MPIRKAVIELKQATYKYDLEALENVFSRASSDPILADALSSIPGEGSNAYKLVNLNYNYWGSGYYRQDEITLLHETLLDSVSLNNDAFKVVKKILEFGAIPFVSDPNGKIIKTTFGTKNDNLIKLLYSFGANPDLYDPLTLEQAAITRLYKNNPVKYILQNAEHEFILQSLNNLHSYCQDRAETTAYLLTQPDKSVDGRGFTQILNKESLKLAQDNAQECLTNIENTLSCIKNHPQESENLDLLCGMDFCHPNVL
jgi:hypothetical protein